MIGFMNVLLFILIAIVIYELALKIEKNKIVEKINKYIQNKNEIYYKNFLKKYEKSKKIKFTENFNIFYKINFLIDKTGFKRSVFINPIAFFFYSIISVIVFYNLTFSFFKMVILSCIISIPTALFPFILLKIVGNYQAEKLEKIFLNFLLQVKNYTKINNDIVSALRDVDTIEPLKTYLKKFHVELNSGIKFEVAIEHLKEKISTGKFQEFFSNIQYCYLYGGNFTNLIDKSYNMISEIQAEKAKRLQETKSAKLVLIILILLNIFVYITYIKNNYDNYLIMQKSIIGILILYWNFISMWLLLWLSSKVSKLDY